MSRPRTPEHFPRMKVRGGRRRLQAKVEQAWRGPAEAAASFGRAVIRITANFHAFAEAMDRLAEQARQLRIATLASFWLARRRARDEWLSRRMLPATPSPWAAPIEQETP